jgi:hypothetical protein
MRSRLSWFLITPRSGIRGHAPLSLAFLQGVFAEGGDTFRSGSRHMLGDRSRDMRHLNDGARLRRQKDWGKRNEHGCLLGPGTSADTSLEIDPIKGAARGPPSGTDPWQTSAVPNYDLDPDIRTLIQSGFPIPDDLPVDEVGRLQAFLHCDQELEECYRRSEVARPPEPILDAVASAAMSAYDQRSGELSVAWQKLLVLRAGLAGAPENLDSGEIQRWVYERLVNEHPEWIGPYDPDAGPEPPLYWLRRMAEDEIGRIELVDRRIAEGDHP